MGMFRLKKVVKVVLFNKSILLLGHSVFRMAKSRTKECDFVPQVRVLYLLTLLRAKCNDQCNKTPQG